MMDTTDFDRLTRVLASGTTRRDMTRLFGGLALGVIALGPRATEAKKGGKGKRKQSVDVCHRGKTVSVSRSVLKGHLRHGDTRGACTAEDAPRNLMCSDGTLNGSETDIDCGGGTCPRCAIGKTCAGRDDCASARCVSGTCQTCANAITDCGTDTDGSQCFCRDHESGNRFCTKPNAMPGRVFPAGTPCTTCQGGEQCFPINGGAGGIECILPCGAPAA